MQVLRLGYDSTWFDQILVIDGFFTPVGKNQKEDTVESCQSFKERYLNQSAKETRKLLIFRVIWGS